MTAYLRIFVLHKLNTLSLSGDKILGDKYIFTTEMGIFSRFLCKRQ